MAVRLLNLRAERVAAGHSITRLAQLANASDLIVTTLESPGANGLDVGGTVNAEIGDRLCDALGISRATAGFVEA